ncbi:Tcp11-domain-containing protein [Plenodomus tracheiphilus IPT5]|uniref:Tcp11-domain-containing protein n=1 Tax=Plenodomus tracheiphilus IPT5 TaxID=1408161 RepID=A0A6A7AY48_9PLEO|nr:Tcp11-domain-containing protein [Plenodomus tracheiphilus IPT5]
MGVHTPNAAGSSSTSFRPSRGYPARTDTMNLQGREGATSVCYGSHMCSEASPPLEGRHHAERHRRPDPPIGAATQDPYISSPNSHYHNTIPDELAHLLRAMIPGPHGEELAEAFQEASEAPPVTKQSLSELDIQSVITNIKLRHDVNFDRDLSFRPNLDGAKGQEKSRVASNYWTALVAELMLYERLYQGTPPVRLGQLQWEAITHHAERRIPTMFQTIANVLKSLVPDRDHSRVDEHLDVAMLMQEIERGICDLVRFAEWMAHLLKEHCAPMRDEWVDDMVQHTREGVVRNDPEMIVQGLRELLGILEAMKLDVANHQIRNLKNLLIEDTINFEHHYHLDRLVSGRSRANINAAQSWYADAIEEFGHQCIPRQRSSTSFQLEAFVRVVVATLFGRNSGKDFPETFYLDQDRLRMLQAELNDAKCLDFCMNTYSILAKEFGYEGPAAEACGRDLRRSLLAMMSEAIGHGSHQWSMNSEAISLEILRHASRLAGRGATAHSDRWPEVNQRLRTLFTESPAAHATHLEASLLPLILTSVQRCIITSPTELYANLVTPTASHPLASTHSSPWLSCDDKGPSTAFHIEFAKLEDLAKRISHVIILHWRIWGSIAYVQEDDRAGSAATLIDGEMASTLPSPPHTPSSLDAERSLTAIKTLELQDPHTSHDTSSS